jgi:hypothetical protein
MTQYIAATYVDNFLGTAVRQALFTDSGQSYSTAAFTGLCVAATSAIQTAIRNAGYVVPTTNTDEYVRMATLGVFIELAYARPEKYLKLPEDWKNSQIKLAMSAILSGEAELSLPLDTAATIGGVTASSSTDKPQIMSRDGLNEY